MFKCLKCLKWSNMKFKVFSVHFSFEYRCLRNNIFLEIYFLQYNKKNYSFFMNHSPILCFIGRNLETKSKIFEKVLIKFCWEKSTILYIKKSSIKSIHPFPLT